VTAPSFSKEMTPMPAVATPPIPTWKPGDKPVQAPVYVKIREDLPPIVTCAEKGHNPDKGIYVATIGGQRYTRRDGWELHFKGSKRFPEGLWLACVEEMVQPDRGQPYTERTVLHIGTDAYDLLTEFAAGRKVVTYLDRVEIFRRAQARRDEISALNSKNAAEMAALVKQAAEINAAKGTTP
jgi:hypothetical protein